ncbi:cytochrome b/b6 domain-containing protein [Rhizobium sp. Leaf341]|uniref:cytochrome b/b6 domain-containing protein n=1 Tax=Rhizobium sp. Leaf341 TaxID=1736344 RepID=UPI000715A8C4|nr:cytochrome b/b6 domain-containing protein [Rhizobium sp. Leaf341]KQR68772.1 HupC [Rhizobium sp. Leaf341]
MTPVSEEAGSGTTRKGRLIYRHGIMTRLTHWAWAVALFFLLLSGLQIFNAHPTLYIGAQSGFAFDNSVLKMDAIYGPDGQPQGRTTVLGHSFDTSGMFGMSGPAENPSYRGFPAWATIPSYQDLATGRVVHFFFAWVLAITLLVWLVSAIATRRLRRDLLPSGRELRHIPRDIADHARLRFRHDGRYNVLQKLSYGGVLFVLFPLVILTGLSMSPTMNAAWPFLLDLFGGRQTARTLHFACMLALVLFFVVHLLMVLLAGPLNELRSIITGRYRTRDDALATEAVSGDPRS